MSSWDHEKQGGAFRIRVNEFVVECFVPLEALIDRFPTNMAAPGETFEYHRDELESLALTLVDRGFGQSGRLVLRGIDFLGQSPMSHRQT
jgi:hypothetical protein